MIDYEENNHDIEIDNIFGRELLELEDFIDHSDLNDERKYTDTSLPLKSNSHNANNILLLEVDQEKINNILNKLISINNPADFVNNYTVTKDFISKYAYHDIKHI